jgi:hypothetical protein
MDIVTDDIRRCYTNMDKFGVDEVQRATKALKNRNFGPKDIERWRKFRGGRENITADWEARIPPDIDCRRSHP